MPPLYDDTYYANHLSRIYGGLSGLIMGGYFSTFNIVLVSVRQIKPYPQEK